jgi:NADPH-dependent 2,4-dienoyl-CoA reductase/sulfur reductase-like enzyme
MPAEYAGADAMTTHRFDVLVVGAGPAGIAAAVRAAEEGCKVGLVDENLHPGGQIWRSSLEKTRRGKAVGDAAEWMGRLSRASVQIFPGRHIFDAPAPKRLRAFCISEAAEFHFRSLVIATGARERFLPFPGWTLPNVLGAGALQTLVKAGLPIAGKRIVIAGTGPLLIAVAACMRIMGAKVVALCEQATSGSMMRFGMGLIQQPSKLMDAVRYARQIRAVRLRTSCWPTAALGEERLEGVVLNDRGRRVELKADYLACGFHLVPNCELALLLGCALDGSYVRVDEFQQTSVTDLFSAGETTGIGGVEAALVEGQIAGLAAAGALEKTALLRKKRDAARRFTRLLDRTYALNPELRRLAAPETILCRCEDVTMEAVQPHSSWRAAKLQSRVGMGSCQGRICGTACEFLFGWGMESVRPPIQPTPVGSLVGANVEDC